MHGPDLGATSAAHHQSSQGGWFAMTSQSMDASSLSIQRRPPGVRSVRTYSTRFLADEDPISEGGIWLNGRKDGIDWANIRTKNGLAHGETIALQVAERRVEQGDEIDVP